MRVLLTNSQMVARTGSELVTKELAEVLRAKGHDVAIFSPEIGPFAADMRCSSGVPIFGVGDPVGGFAPDVVHANDWPSLVVLQHMGVAAPALFGALGVLPPVANPPPLRVGQRLHWWAISLGIEGHVEQIPGWADCPHLHVPNWFDDRGLQPRAGRAGGPIRRALVVSNHFPAAVMARLRRLGEAGQFTVDHVGLPHNPRIVDAQLLHEYDCVVTLGRTAILAMALGIPALVVDIHGADGWIRPEHYEELARANFSGRAHRLEPTADLLSTLLSDPPTRAELVELQDRVWATRRLAQAAEAIEGLLQDAAVSGCDATFGPWSAVVAEYVIRAERDRQELSARAAALEAADVREQRARIQLALWEAELANRAAALAEADATVQQLRDILRGAREGAEPPRHALPHPFHPGRLRGRTFRALPRMGRSWGRG